MNKSLEFNFWSILYNSIVFLCLQTPGNLSKTKHFNLQELQVTKVCGLLFSSTLYIRCYRQGSMPSMVARVMMKLV